MENPSVKMINTVNKTRLVHALIAIGAIAPIQAKPGSDEDNMTKNLQEKFKGVGLVVQFEITPVGERILIGQLVRRMTEEFGPESATLPSEERQPKMVQTIRTVKAEIGGEPTKLDLLFHLTTESCEDAGLFKPEDDGRAGNS